jgi:hypothetical protein
MKRISTLLEKKVNNFKTEFLVVGEDSVKEGSLLLLIGAVDDLGGVGKGEDLFDSGHVSRLWVGYFCLMASLS